MDNISIGFLLLLAAGICQGSFGIGYKKYNPFSWAVFWGIYSFLCIIVSVTFTWIMTPKLWSAFGTVGLKSMILPLSCGALWGLSAIGFSKGIDKIGMTMVYGISMGISTIVGSITPMLISREAASEGLDMTFCIKLLLTLAGVVVVTVAGIIRDGGIKASKIGIALAVFSGFGSGAMNAGFSGAEVISDELMKLGYSNVCAAGAKWLPVLVGGCIMGILWCVGEAFAKNELRTAVAHGSVKRIGILFGVSIVWYAALLLYGIVTIMLDDMGETVGWILFNSLALLISVGWGIKFGEWNIKDKAFMVLLAGCIILIFSWIGCIL